MNNLGLGVVRLSRPGRGVSEDLSILRPMLVVRHLSPSDDLLVRRFGMIHSFIQSAKVAAHPILIGIDGHDPVGTNAFGKPISFLQLHKTVAGKPQNYRAILAASCCVAAVNLGYAYEHALKLLYFLEKKENFDFNRGGGHNLAGLYKSLSMPLREKLSEINNGIPSHDVEIDEEFGNKGEIAIQQRIGEPVDLCQLLEYWTDKQLLHESRYKYSDEVELPCRRRFLVPLRSIFLLEEILSEVLAPRLNLKYVRTDLFEVARTSDPEISIIGVAARGKSREKSHC